MKARKEVQEMKKGDADSGKDATENSAEKDAGEEIDIDLEDPDVEDAAVKIQAGFKGMKARKEVQEIKKSYGESGKHESQNATENKNEEEEIDIDLEDPDVEDAAVKIQAGFKGMKARKEVQEMKKGDGESGKHESGKDESENATDKNVEEGIDIDLDDPDVEDAAVKIQAGFKGMKARKEVQDMKKMDGKSSQDEAENSGGKDAEEEIDIDLEDPEVGEAAVKIQAGFRGMQARKEVSEKKTDSVPDSSMKGGDSDKEEEEEIDIDLEDPDVGEAAVKIQAGFRGMQARKEVEDMKKEVGEEVEVKEKDAAKNEKEEQEEEIDIDLEDQGVQDATVKIQAGFRGMQARKEVDSMKKEKQQQEGEGVDNDDIDIDLEDEGVQDATVKIQAGFRGMQARREVAEIRASRDQGSKSSGSKGEIANYDSANEYTEDSESGGGDLKLRFRYGICQTTFIFFSKQIRRKVVALRRKRRKKTKGSRIKTAAVSVSRWRRRKRRNKYDNVDLIY